MITGSMALDTQIRSVIEDATGQTPVSLDEAREETFLRPTLATSQKVPPRRMVLRDQLHKASSLLSAGSEE